MVEAKTFLSKISHCAIYFRKILHILSLSIKKIHAILGQNGHKNLSFKNMKNIMSLDRYEVVEEIEYIEGELKIKHIAFVLFHKMHFLKSQFKGTSHCDSLLHFI